MFSGPQRFNRRCSGKGNTDQATSSTVALTPEVNAHSRSHRCYQDHGGSNGCVQKRNTDQARCSTVAFTAEVCAHPRSHRCYQDHRGSNDDARVQNPVTITTAQSAIFGRKKKDFQWQSSRGGCGGRQVQHQQRAKRRQCPQLS